MRTALAMLVGMLPASGLAHPCEGVVARLRADVEAHEAKIAKIRTTVIEGLASSDPVIVRMAQNASARLTSEEAQLAEEKARLGRNEDRCNELVWAEQPRGK